MPPHRVLPSPAPCLPLRHLSRSPTARCCRGQRLSRRRRWRPGGLPGGGAQNCRRWGQRLRRRPSRPGCLLYGASRDLGWLVGDRAALDQDLIGAGVGRDQLVGVRVSASAATFFAGLAACRAAVLPLDEIVNDGTHDAQGDQRYEGEAHKLRGDVDPTPQHQLDAQEDKDRGHRIRQQREEVDQLVDHKEGGAQAEHGKHARRVRQEEVWDLSNDRRDRVHREDHVRDLQEYDDKGQAGRDQLVPRLVRRSSSTVQPKERRS
mmetsp:Transcript_1995/g.5397  ORF Transcript_1995/g.5397 Transcript_1995/m.5397 type:complete len:263 (+) Transcript_1995:170-958(+)